MDKKNQGNRFIQFVVVVASIIIIVLLCVFLLDTTGKINQGNFRVNDVVIYSAADVQDTPAQNAAVTADTTANASQQTAENLSDVKFNVSQKNYISFLIAKPDTINVESIYIDNVKITYPKLYENMYIYQSEDKKIDLKSKNIKLDLTKEDQDGQFLVKFNIDNINCIKQAGVPENTTSITYDGTIFSILNTKISDISFNIEFNLNIADSSGKINICKVKLNLPNQMLITSGVSIVNEDTGDFPFRIK